MPTENMGLIRIRDCNFQGDQELTRQLKDVLGHLIICRFAEDKKIKAFSLQVSRLQGEDDTLLIVPSVNIESVSVLYNDTPNLINPQKTTHVIYNIIALTNSTVIKLEFKKEDVEKLSYLDWKRVFISIKPEIKMRKIYNLE